MDSAGYWMTLLMFSSAHFIYIFCYTSDSILDKLMTKRNAHKAHWATIMPKKYETSLCTRQPLLLLYSCTHNCMPMHTYISICIFVCVLPNKQQSRHFHLARFDNKHWYESVARGAWHFLWITWQVAPLRFCRISLVLLLRPNLTFATYQRWPAMWSVDDT